ncbi:hypothetical protein JCM3775_001304 [Rhodotorula graminis]
MADKPKKRHVVPIALVVDPSPASDSLIAPYAQAVISALQALHPTHQLLLTCVTPSSHASPLNPFLPPAAFLSALPSYTRRPARPASTLWRSTTGLLRAIRLARSRIVEGSLAGAGGEGRGQLPKYVVVISATDVDNMGGDEVWLEDDDQGESWESFAKSFTKGQHCTTLFSLISLGYTPNLETFWKESSGRFPANLIYNSLAPPPNPGFSFPVLSPSHAAFLIGFYNQHASRPAPQPQSGAPSPAAAGANKRTAPPDPAAAANKKPKPNPSGAAVSPHLGNANLAGVKQQQPTPPNPSRTPNHPQPSPRLVPNRSPSMPTVPANLTNETLQQYIADMQAAAARSGQPPPTAADIQAAALAAYARANGSRAPGSTGPPSANLPVPPHGQQQQQQQQQTTPRQMTQQQLNGLPQIPPDMKAKIEVHLETIRKKVERGELTQEQAGQQVKRLQEMANQHRYQLAQQQKAAERINGALGQAQAQAQGPPQHGQGQGLGLNIPLAPGLQTPQLAPAQPLPPLQPQPQHPPQQQQQQQARKEPERPRTVWRGPISWALTEVSGTTAEYTMFCQAVPMQQSAIRDLADVKFPQSWRISSLVQIKMAALQELANKHTLPAMSLSAIPSESLPDELRKKQLAAPGGHANEALYGMFAQSMEMRGHCGVARFSGTPHGLVLIPVPQQNKLLALVFTKIPLPEAWLQDSKASATSSTSTPHQRAHSAQQQQQSAPPPPPPPLQPVRPNSAQSGMFSSPIQPPYQMPHLSPSLQAQAAPPSSFAGALPPAPFNVGGAPLQQQQQQQNFQLQPPPMQQQQQAPQQQAQPQTFPEGGVAGMDFAELQRLLGAEQFAQIMSGI